MVVTVLTFRKYVAALISGVLLALPYNFPNLFLLAWVGFIPLLWAANSSRFIEIYCLGLTSGVMFQLVAASWIIDFIRLYKGIDVVTSIALSVVFWGCCAQVIALLILCYRWVTTYTNLHVYMVFPLAVTAFYSAFPVQLGEGQSRFTTALQAIEYMGVYGLDFIIALVNICLFRLLSLRFGGDKKVIESKGFFQRNDNTMVAIVVSVWMIYGCISLNKWDQDISTWSTRSVGMVQPNESPSVSLPPPRAGYSLSYPVEMQLTELLVAEGVDVVIWPETRYKGYYRYPHIKHAFESHIEELATPVIFQDTERREVESKLYNTALLLDSHGELAAEYRKIKRVPFAEYLPVIDMIPGLKDFIYSYLSDFFLDFSSGQQSGAFNVAGISLIPLICYEILFPDFTAQSVGEDGRGKVIVALSNTGWFGQSRQPYLHLNASLLRSIENRLPMIHVSNNGPSAVVLPNGRFLSQTAFQQQQAIRVNMPYSQSSGGSFYSRHPYWFSNIIFMMCILMSALALFNHLKKPSDVQHRAIYY